MQVRIWEGWKYDFVCKSFTKATSFAEVYISFREPFQPTAGFLSTENLASSARAFSCTISMVDHKVFCEEKQCLCWAGLLETSA
jgi:hypothetical protein